MESMTDWLIAAGIVLAVLAYLLWSGRSSGASYATQLIDQEELESSSSSDSISYAEEDMNRILGNLITRVEEEEE